MSARTLGQTLGPALQQTLGPAWSLVTRWYSIPLLLLVWEVAVGSGLVESRLLPSPLRVWDALVTDLGNGTLVYHAGVTLYRALTGFVLAALIGVPFAAAMARSTLIRNLFEPIFFFGYPVPKIALFPVFTYIFGIGTPSKIAFTFLECLYPIVVTCYFGFRGVQTRLIWSAQNCGADRATILRRVIFPAAMPSIFAGLRIALPVAIIVVVITEMIGDSIGLGYYITIWSTRFTFANVYAAIIVIGICGLVLDQAMLLARHRVVYWQREAA
jgi:NitT/TauT family transport system permease protein